MEKREKLDFRPVLAVRPDGKALVTGQDSEIRLEPFSVGYAEGSEKAEEAGWRGTCFSPEAIAFSPDGSRVAWGGGDDTVALLGAATGEEIAMLWRDERVTAIRQAAEAKAPGGFVMVTDSMPIRAVAFSPDGKMLAAGGGRGIVRVWDLVGGRECLRIEAGRDVWKIAFSADGRHLAAVGGQTGLRVWDLTAPAGVDDPARGRDPARALGELEGAEALQAVQALAKDSRALVDRARRELLDGLRPPSAARVEKLVADLDHAEMPIRGAAASELEGIAWTAEDLLRAILKEKGDLSAEQRDRIERILANGEDRPPRGLRGALRLIQALSWDASAEAKALLAEVAERSPLETIRKEARAAAGRLSR